MHLETTQIRMRMSDTGVFRFAVPADWRVAASDGRTRLQAIGPIEPGTFVSNISVQLYPRSFNDAFTDFMRGSVTAEWIPVRTPSALRAILANDATGPANVTELHYWYEETTPAGVHSANVIAMAQTTRWRAVAELFDACVLASGFEGEIND